MVGYIKAHESYQNHITIWIELMYEAKQNNIENEDKII